MNNRNFLTVVFDVTNMYQHDISELVDHSFAVSTIYGDAINEFRKEIKQPIPKRTPENTISDMTEADIAKLAADERTKIKDAAARIAEYHFMKNPNKNKFQIGIDIADKIREL